MASPFEKRAIEKIRHDEAFLPFVAPAPLEIFLRPHAQEEVLFDRLVVMTGTPGSGKTTMARLFGVHTLLTLHRLAQASEPLAELRDTLAGCGAYAGEYPRVAAVRISMENDYRDCWECPYDEATRHRLLRTLVHARAMLGWFQSFRDARLDLSRIRIVGRRRTPGELDTIGGESALDASERAAQVEAAVYRICSALLPPPVEKFPAELTEPYAPLDLIERFEVQIDGQDIPLAPLLILDDVHELAEPQRDYLIRRWLALRELAISRWILMRFDALNPAHILYDQSLSRDLNTDPAPGVQHGRDITEIRLQRGERARARTDFRSVARQMSRRYLEQIPLMHNRGAVDLKQMLEEQLIDVEKTQRDKARQLADRAIRKNVVSARQVEEFRRQVEAYLERRDIRGLEADVVGDAMLAILASRFGKRAPQQALFATPPEEVPDDYGVRATPGVEHGARVHLWHHAQIPYLFGFDDLADLANENAERFLNFAGKLVGLIQTRAIRGHDTRLPAKMQFQVLREHATELIRGWNFPESNAVRRLAAGMAQQCVAKSIEPNAPLNGGANAFGIPMEEYLALATDQPDLARALQFGSAYNVFALVPQHRTKNRDWCLIELGGPILIAHGLTTQRGGFLERGVKDLIALMDVEVARG